MALRAEQWQNVAVADIVNLRRERRKRDQAEADVKAAENRALHGRTKAERERDRKQAELDRKKLDVLRRNDP
jgi:hypothetical protein